MIFMNLVRTIPDHAHFYRAQIFKNKTPAMVCIFMFTPTRYMHGDSHYRCMGFVAIRDSNPVCWLFRSSDVLFLDGIGGYRPEITGFKQSMPPIAWHIDCLPCGVIHLWSNNYRLCAGPSLSSFEIFRGKER